jgi:hypothetical protein
MTTASFTTAAIWRPLLLASLFNALPAAAQDSWTTSAGLDYSTGKYGRASRTDTWYVPFGIKYESDPFIVRLTVPYVRIRGQADVVGSGADRVDLGNNTNRMRETEGLGDIVLLGSRTVLEQDGWMADLGAKVKFGTGDKDKGLGTGKNDYSLQADIYRSLGGGHTLFATLGAKKMGDPDGIDLHDPLFGSLGWAQRYSPTTSLGLSYDYRQKIQDQGQPISEMSAFVTYKLNERWKLQSYLVKGFSDGSPDFGGGFVLSLVQ